MFKEIIKIAYNIHTSCFKLSNIAYKNSLYGVYTEFTDIPSSIT